MSDDDELIKHMTSLIAAGLDRIEVLTAEAAKMLSEADYKYNRKTNDMIERHAEQVKALTAERDGLLRCVTDNHVALCRAEKAEAERDRLREALRGLERASTEVASCGARTGPHWLKLTVANLSARAALKGETP